MAALEAAGAPDAGRFFAAWKRDGARIHVRPTSIAPDGDGWKVAIERIGDVPYPVDIEIALESGERPRRTLAADADEAEWSVGSRPVEFIADPDGVIPLLEPGHPEMRSVLARALERAGFDGPFLALGREVLGERPDDDYLRWRVVRRLTLLARWEEAVAAWGEAEDCDSYAGCIAGVYAALALRHAGEVTPAPGS